MLSILGRIGLLLRHPGFYVDQLDVIYTRPDRSFIAPSGLLCGPIRCYLYLVGYVFYCAIRAFMFTLYDEEYGQKYE